jgi:hypothetical protein
MPAFARAAQWRFAPILLGCALAPFDGAPDGPPPGAQLVVYRGLASPRLEPALFDAQRATESVLRLGGEAFFERPSILPPPAYRRMIGVLISRDLYDGRLGIERCLFHADYAVAWDDVRLLLCFGCGEIRRIEAGAVERYTMDPKLKEGLRRLLDSGTPR